MGFLRNLGIKVVDFEIIYEVNSKIYYIKIEQIANIIIISRETSREIAEQSINSRVSI